MCFSSFGDALYHTTPAVSFTGTAVLFLPGPRKKRGPCRGHRPLLNSCCCAMGPPDRGHRPAGDAAMFISPDPDDLDIVNGPPPVVASLGQGKGQHGRLGAGRIVQVDLERLVLRRHIGCDTI
jgi:hypothetical protein